MADRRASNTAHLAHCGTVLYLMVLGAMVLFWLGSSAYLAYSNSLSKPIEGIPYGVYFVWYFFVSFIMGPIVLFFTPEGWTALAVIFGVWWFFTLCFAVLSQSPCSIDEPDSPEHSEHDAEVSKVPRKIRGVATLPPLSIVISVVAVIWFISWAVTRDLWWFLNGLDALR